MTPPAATAAARLSGAASPQRPVPTMPQRRSGERTSLRRVPRRVSGPQAPAPRAAPIVEPVARRAEAVAPARATRSGEVGVGFLGRTRLWTAALILALAFVVFLQGQLRSLDSTVGSSVQSITTLERDNAVLRSQISGLSSDQRIVSQAKRMGFVEPPIGSSVFLAASGHDNGRALALMSPAAPGSAYASLDIDQQAPSVEAARSPTGGPGAITGVAAPTTAAPGTGAEGTVTTAAVPDGGTDPTGG